MKTYNYIKITIKFESEYNVVDKILWAQSLRSVKFKFVEVFSFNITNVIPIEFIYWIARRSTKFAW